MKPESMTIAVFSDIHSNHIALEACIAYIDQAGIENILFLGDYVSNCAYPAKTMDCIYELMERKKCWFIRGNREEMLVNHAKGVEDNWEMPSTKSGSIYYTYNNLRKKDIDFFAGMGICGYMDIEGFPRFAYCHGSMESAYVIMDQKEARRFFDTDDINLLVCGHTHEPGSWQYERGKVVNGGSIGMPGNAEGKAEFVILHGSRDGWKEEFVAVEYDRMETVREMEQSGVLEQSLMFGRMIKDLLLTKKYRWNELLELAGMIYRMETGTETEENIPEAYLEKAAEKMGIA